MDREEMLFRQYEKIVDLFMSESRTAWELVSIYVGIQIALFSAIALIFIQQASHAKTIAYIIVSLAGIISSLAWVLIQYRAKMWRDNWLLAGLRIERELANEGKKFLENHLVIFGFENLVREKKQALELFGEEIRYRNQRWHEKLGALRLPHIAMHVLTVVWLGILIWELTAKLL